MPDKSAKFEKTTDVIKIDDSLGIVYGWAAVFTENGQEYFDTQGDAIDPMAAEAAALDFMKNSRVAGDLHETVGGTVPFLMPITDEVAKSLGIESARTGLAIGMHPNPDVLAKFKSGEYTGFSIGGTRIDEVVVEKMAKRGDKDGDDDKPKFRQGRRRRMTKFSLDEISAVDMPAQVGAKATLIKRKGEPGYDPDNPDPKKRGRLEDFLAKRAVLTTPADGHTHLLIVDPEDGTGARPAGYTEGGGMDFHSHPWVMNSEGEIVIGASNGHTHDAGQLSTTQEMAMSSLLNKQSESTMPEPTIKDLLKRQERLEKVAALDDVRKAHFQTLEGDAADAFLALSAEQQSAEVVAKRREGDGEDVVYTASDGTIYKRADDPRLVKMAQERDEDRASIAKMAADAAHEKLCKRAETTLPNLPGDREVRAAVLKQIESIPDEAMRKKALEAVQAGDKAIKSAFATVGTTEVGNVGGGSSDAQQELDRMAKALVEKDPSVDYYDAYEKVSLQNSDLAKRAIGIDAD